MSFLVTSASSDPEEQTDPSTHSSFVSSPDVGGGSVSAASTNTSNQTSLSFSSRKRKACHTQQRQQSSSSSNSTEKMMMKPSSSNTLHRMAKEEQTSRSTRDYQALIEASSSSNNNDGNNNTSTAFQHNQLWRERVAKWCYDVLDYLEESRDVAYVAMNFLDRYLAVRSRKETRSSLQRQLDVKPFEFEVMAFTSLFLAIRVCGVHKELQIPELLQLSSSGARSRHILEAGHDMLEKLSWAHRILTPHVFLKEYLALFVSAGRSGNNVNNSIHSTTPCPAPISQSQVESLLDFACYLVEVSVCDSYFNAVAPSEVALGALVVAMTCDANLASQQQGFLASYFRTIEELTSISIESTRMKNLVSRLLDVYNQSHEASVSSSTVKNDETSHEHNQGSSSSNSESASTLLSSPHLIIDDTEGEDDDAIMGESPMLATTLAEGVMALDELRSISPSSSLDLLQGSGIVRMAE